MMSLGRTGAARRKEEMRTYKIKLSDGRRDRAAFDAMSRKLIRAMGGAR